MDALISALPLLIILACPLMMIFMMRGMHGGNDDQPDQRNHSPFDSASDARIAELEREVAALRDKSRNRDDAPVGRP